MSLGLEVVANGSLASVIQNCIARRADAFSSLSVQLTSKLSDWIQGNHSKAISEQFQPGSAVTINLSIPTLNKVLISFQFFHLHT